MDHRFTPDNIPPPPPFAPGRGHPAMDPLPHDFAERPHIIEPPQHRNSIPSPGYGEDRRSSFNSGRDPSNLESYTISREPNYAIAKRARWSAKEDELREIVRKQQKRGTSAYVPLNKDQEIKHNRRGQVSRLIQDRNCHPLNDQRTKYELAALKVEEFTTRKGPDSRLKVILRRKMRPGLPNDPNHPITAPPPIPPTEIIDLTQSDDYERSSQSSYPSLPVHEPGHGGFSHPVHPPVIHHGGHAGAQIFDPGFSQQPFGSPLGEEQPRAPRRVPVVIDQQHDRSSGFEGNGHHDNGHHGHEHHGHDHHGHDHHDNDHHGNTHHGNDHSENKKGKGDKSKGKQKQQHDESDSSSASETEMWSVNSDATPLSTISSSRSSYRGDKRPSHKSPQRQFSTHSHNDRDRGIREEKFYRKESHGGENRGRGIEEKTYRHDGPKAGRNGHERENRGSSSKKEKIYYPDSHHHRSFSVDRDDRGRNDKKEKKYKHESRRDSHSREREERSYKTEKKYRPESHSSKADGHHRDYRQTATREHVRKVPVGRPRGSLSDDSPSYTDDEYIVIPQKGPRRVLYQDVPVRSRRALEDDEESHDYFSRPLGRSNTTTYRPKLANKPFRPVDLHDSRFDYARERAEVQRQPLRQVDPYAAELQRQRDLELQREEDRIVAQHVQEHLLREDEEMRLRHQRRTEMAREESSRRIAIKVREELQRATRLGRERQFDDYELPLPGRRASVAYPHDF